MSSPRTGAGRGGQDDAHIAPRVPFAEPGEHAVAAAPDQLMVEDKYRRGPLAQLRHAVEAVHRRRHLEALLRQETIENAAQFDITFGNQQFRFHDMLRGIGADG